MEEKEQAIYDYTVESIRKIQDAGVAIGMIQVGNETTNGFCVQAAGGVWGTMDHFLLNPAQ